MKILVVNGPNLNLLGKRDHSKYGTITLGQLNNQLNRIAKETGVSLTFFQSNHEGAIIDFLQKDASRDADGVLINPGALVRYGWSLRQALIDLGKPIVEVHMSDINSTGVNKAVNVLEGIRIDQIVGLKEQSYELGLKKLLQIIL
ncbi:MAG TPA: type II 3-dehydroquinate dehydratase [Patescibacteria group bacterium]|nr:type II 3-dehydroquinate dehydratase [Patescibacteria group bacterium]